ncbi:MAG: hypothetical protein JNK46_20780 [Methylobacteriaceae bacterium]|nr:hypothetical protein [Methylobacteriaceae bacterium]
MSGSAAARASRRRLFACVALAFAPALAGCVDTVSEARPSVARSEIARRADVSPKGAEVALVSVDGAPESVASRFAAALRAESGAREIVFAEAAKARYHLRGYLSAAPAKEGVAVTYVWDVFDSGKRRAQRMSDEIVVKARAGGDPWEGLDEAALASLAAKSADDLAAFLSNTPEAIAAAKAPAAPARPGARSGPALSFAPAE